MNHVVLMICIFLVVGAIALFCIAFSHENEGASESHTGPNSRILKWGGLGTLLVGLAVVLFLFVFMPGIVKERIKEAEDITRNTFREKIRREPDRITFDATDRKAGDGWKYVGTAHL